MTPHAQRPTPDLWVGLVCGLSESSHLIGCTTFGIFLPRAHGFERCHGMTGACSMALLSTDHAARRRRRYLTDLYEQTFRNAMAGTETVPPG